MAFVSRFGDLGSPQDAARLVQLPVGPSLRRNAITNSSSSLSNSLSLPLNPSLSEGGKKSSFLPPFVQLADSIETPGKISEIQRQRRELNRAESQIGAEGS